MIHNQIMQLYWDTTYAVAVALIEHYPDLNPVEIGLVELADLVEALPNFVDDTAVVTERMLTDIQITWYEEITNP
ncbi:MAG: Fe-S cluster assembly protein IscX [Anaerolineales bacterium]|nr:Fe-S cluster assembly protein IscX [Anaerolineales bacterium]